MELLLIAAMLAAGEQDAWKTSARAYVKQEGYDVHLRQIQDRTIDKDTQRIAGYALAIHRVAIEHKVTFRWSFP